MLDTFLKPAYKGDGRCARLDKPTDGTPITSSRLKIASRGHKLLKDKRDEGDRQFIN